MERDGEVELYSFPESTLLIIYMLFIYTRERESELHLFVAIAGKAQCPRIQLA